MTILQQTNLAEVLAPIFEKINNENWDQSIGWLSSHKLTKNGELKPGVKCCVGLHIALGVNRDLIECIKSSKISEEFNITHKAGASYVMDTILDIDPRMNIHKINALFHCAGAPENPFSTRIAWEKHPIDVLNNMEHIETLPPFPIRFFNADMSTYLSNTLVKQWLKRERRRIEQANKLKELQILDEICNSK